VGFLVTEFVEKARLDGFIGIGGKDAIDVGPDDEFVGVDDVRDDGAGKIGTVAAKGGDAAIGSCTDEAGNDRDDTGFEERKKNVAAALFGLCEMRLSFAEGVAGQDELGGRDGHCGDAGFFKSGSKKPCTEAFAERGEEIEAIRAGGDAGADGNFVKQIASQELQFAADAKVRVFTEVQVVEHIEVKIQDELCFAAGVGEFSFG
jgi:hypothetical protein